MALVFIDGQYSHIQCDGEKCGVRSPSPAEMMAAHGLSNMGWFVGGGIHRCPVHYTETTEARGPIYMIHMEVDGKTKLVLDPKKL